MTILIASSAEQQLTISEEIKSNTINVLDISEKTASLSNDLSESSSSLEGLAVSMQDLVSRFKITI